MYAVWTRHLSVAICTGSLATDTGLIMSPMDNKVTEKVHDVRPVFRRPMEKLGVIN